jgi:hypothetical protein
MGVNSFQRVGHFDEPLIKTGREANIGITGGLQLPLKLEDLVHI